MRVDGEKVAAAFEKVAAERKPNNPPPPDQLMGSTG